MFWKYLQFQFFAPFTTSLITSASGSFQIQILAGKISPLHFPYRILLLSKVWTFFCGIQNIVNRIIRQRKSKCGICKGNDFAIADIGEILLDLQKSYFSNFQWTILVSIIFRAILISLAFMYTLRRLKYFHHRVGKNASQIEKKMIYSYSNVGIFLLFDSIRRC